MLKLKLQYFGHLMQRADSLKKTLMLGKIEGAVEMGEIQEDMEEQMQQVLKRWGGEMSPT